MAAAPRKISPQPAAAPAPSMIDVVLQSLEDAKAEQTVA
ncbi:unnamed protein product, partial [Laminaria digitata]